ncbi:MAG TPA: hypothetical protein VFP44_21460 [Usitatibacter sp.]|nr:hypothetical protein [Usitatibacter sp.]
MKSSTIVMSLITASGLALATVALAHPGFGPGGGYGPGHGMGMGAGMGMMGGGCGPAGAQGAGTTPLFTPEEMTAFRERMRGAATVEERQRLMLEHRTEMQKRAGERGWTCPGLAANTGK